MDNINLKFNSGVAKVFENITLDRCKVEEFKLEFEDKNSLAKNILDFWLNISDFKSEELENRIKDVEKESISDDLKEKLENITRLSNNVKKIQKIIENFNEVIYDIKNECFYSFHESGNVRNNLYINILSNDNLEVSNKEFYSNLKYICESYYDLSDKIYKPIYEKNFILNIIKMNYMYDFIMTLNNVNEKNIYYERIFSSKKKYLSILKEVHNENFIKHSVLASKMQMTSQALTDYIKKLPDLGLIIKDIDKGGSYYYLTGKGEEIVKKYNSKKNIINFEKDNIELKEKIKKLEEDNNNLNRQLDFIRNQQFVIDKYDNLQLFLEGISLKINFNKSIIESLYLIFDNLYKNLDKTSPLELIKKFNCNNQNSQNMKIFFNYSLKNNKKIEKAYFNCFNSIRKDNFKLLNSIYSYFLDQKDLFNYLNSEDVDSVHNGFFILIYGSILLKLDLSTLKELCTQKLHFDKKLTDSFCDYFLTNYNKLLTNYNNIVNNDINSY